MLPKSEDARKGRVWSRQPLLHSWRWEGRGPRNQTLRGYLVATSKREVTAQLAEQQIKVTHIQRRQRLRMQQRIAAHDIMVFARQMATMIRAHIPLLQALHATLESQKKPAMATLIHQLAESVAAGDEFARALGRHPRHFDTLFLNLVEAGEQSGRLADMLERIAHHQEKMATLKQRIKKALWYPLTVLFVGLSVTLLLLIKVVPEFESMFQGLDAELPWLTQFTVMLSTQAQLYWPLLLVAIALAAFAIKLGLRSPRVAYALDAWILRLPCVGGLAQKAAVARFASTLATTAAAGIPLTEGLRTARGATRNRVYVRAMTHVEEDIASGQPLYTAMRLTNRFPVMAIQMIHIGEASGALEALLGRVADYYDKEVDTHVDTLTSLMEPLVIVVLGILVGAVVLAMYLPIFHMGMAL